jgi:hypothetical protein
MFKDEISKRKSVSFTNTCNDKIIDTLYKTTILDFVNYCYFLRPLCFRNWFHFHLEVNS